MSHDEYTAVAAKLGKRSKRTVTTNTVRTCMQRLRRVGPFLEGHGVAVAVYRMHAPCAPRVINTYKYAL